MNFIQMATAVKKTSYRLARRSALQDLGTTCAEMMRFLYNFFFTIFFVISAPYFQKIWRTGYEEDRKEEVIQKTHHLRAGHPSVL